MRSITADQLRDMAWGACFLGSGGGGSLNAAEGGIDDLPAGAAVRVATVEEAAASGRLSAVVAFGGAPSKSSGRATMSAQPVIAALHRLDEHCRRVLGKEIGYVAPVEVGAVNTVAACLAAHGSGLAVLDADGAGRAVPLLTMTTFAAKRPNPSPLVLSNGTDETITLEVDDVPSFQHLFGGIVGTKAFGGFAGLAMWPMSGDELRGATPITGTLTLAEELGRILRKGKQNAPDQVIATLRDRGIRAYLLFTGKLEHDQRLSQAGHDSLQATLRNDEDEVRIYILNENLVAWKSSHSRPLAMAPDLISFIDVANGRPLSNARETAPTVTHESKREPMREERRRWGGLIDIPGDLDRVALVGVEARSELRTDPLIQASTRFLLARLGYPGVYQPIETIHGD